MVAPYHHDERIDDTKPKKRQWPSKKDFLGLAMAASRQTHVVDCPDRSGNCSH
jgi:hypothetical protein